MCSGRTSCLKTLIMCEDVPPSGTSSTKLELIFMHIKQNHAKIEGELYNFMEIN